jgi:hypothetical protein
MCWPKTSFAWQRGQPYSAESAAVIVPQIEVTDHHLGRMGSRPAEVLTHQPPSFADAHTPMVMSYIAPYVGPHQANHGPPQKHIGRHSGKCR